MRVLVTLQIPLEDLAPLDGIAEIIMPDDPRHALTHQQVCERIGDCQALLNQGELHVDERVLDAAPDLKIVANCAMGIDNLKLDAITARKVWATNTPDAFVESTADVTLGLLISVARKFGVAEKFARSGRWSSEGKQPRLWEGSLLGGKTLGLIGYGRIAKAVEIRARAFGLNVLHTRATASNDPNYRSFDDLLACSDFITVHPPLTPETHHLIDSAALAKMKPGARLVNVARGPVVDEQALVEALTSGQLGGAGLDVFENEPQIHPGLLELDNVVLLPHIGGATREERRKGRLQAAENIARVLSGESPPNAVNQPG